MAEHRLDGARLLVTGGAGFIGTNFVRLALERWPGARVHVLDALTYAGNKKNLEGVVDPSRLTFQHGDIRDPKAVAQAMEGATHVVNFAAESMVDRSIDDPGSFSGRINSPNPERGPEPNSLISLAILNSETATVLSAPCANTMASCDASASNLFSALTKGSLVISAILAANASAKSGLVLSPVPTAVPPWASA